MANVSFVIPFYNSADTIDATIASIRSQSYRDYDIWIIDDGSIYESSKEKLELLAKEEKVTVLMQENAGPAVARNEAIKRSNAQFIVPLDADDKIMPEALTIALPFFDQHPQIGAVYGDLQFFGEQTGIKVQDDFDIRKALLYNQVAMCSVIRKSVFEKSGYFDTFMSKPGLEDWEFWIRVTEDGWRLLHIPQILFQVRVRSSSRTFQQANKNLSLLYRHVWAKHALTVRREYEKLFYERKQLAETPDYRIGNKLMAPYRALKKLFKG